jgi:hypothetical protein
VFSSRSASTWVTIVITVFAFVLSTRAIAKHVSNSSMAWRPLGKSVSWRSATSASGVRGARWTPSPHGLAAALQAGHRCTLR